MTVPSDFWTFEYLVLSWWYRLRRIRTHKLVGRNAVLGAYFEVSKATQHPQLNLSPLSGCGSRCELSALPAITEDF